MAKAQEKTEKPAKKPRAKRAYLPAAERRKLIIAAAQRVFAENNLKGARTRAIAEAANVNQATIFEHFESKEALFEAAVVQPLLDTMRGMVERAKGYEEADSIDQVQPVATESAKRQIETTKEIFPLFTAALFSDPEQGAKLYKEQIAPLIAERGDAIAGITRDELDPHLIALSHFGMFFMLALHSHFTGEDQDAAELARHMTIHSLKGFFSPPEEK